MVNVIVEVSIMKVVIVVAVVLVVAVVVMIDEGWEPVEVTVAVVVMCQ